MTKSTRPISISASRYRSRVGFGELVRQDGRHRVLRREQRRRDLRGVADDHRHGHRLAQRAAEAEHDRADDAGARVEQRGAGSPRSASRRARRRPRAAPSGTDFSTSRATDDVNGMIMIARISAGRQHADAERRTAEERKLARGSRAWPSRASARAGTSTKMPHSP